MTRRLLGTFFVLGGFGWAQQEVVPTDGPLLFRSEVSLVKVDLKVTGATGGNIGDLRQEDLIVFDEGVPQKTSFFGRESEPLDLLLVLDVSSSMRPSLQAMTQSANLALAQLREGDRVGVLLFAARTDLAQPLTENRSSTVGTVINSIYKDRLGRETFVAEALVAAGQYLNQDPAKRRRAVVMITDNGGERKQASDDEAVRAISSADAVVYAIVVGSAKPPFVRGQYQSPAAGPPDVFNMAARTGGEAIASTKVADILPSVIEKIVTRYSLQYPAPAGEPGSFRKIRIELTEDAKRRHPQATILARDGYRVGE